MLQPQRSETSTSNLPIHDPVDDRVTAIGYGVKYGDDDVEVGRKFEFTVDEAYDAVGQVAENDEEKDEAKHLSDLDLTS